PFGFQSERRSFWAAPGVYDQASAFFHADKINEPLLLVHGADDANPGTETTHSPRLFQAIRGNGGTTRLVMLPFEPHWYDARESNEHFVAEMLAWFDRYVKNPGADGQGDAGGVKRASRGAAHGSQRSTCERRKGRPNRPFLYLPHMFSTKVARPP